MNLTVFDINYNCANNKCILCSYSYVTKYLILMHWPVILEFRRRNLFLAKLRNIGFIFFIVHQFNNIGIFLVSEEYLTKHMNKKKKLF